jgi:hypothetical protein
MGHEIHLQGARMATIPVREGPDWDLLPEQCSGLRGALLFSPGPVGKKEPIDGGCGNTHKEPLGFRSDLEHPFPLEHGHNLGEKRRQALGADLPTSFPDLEESSLYVRGVYPGSPAAVQVLRFSPVPQEPDGRLAVVTGEGHELVEDPALFLPAGAKIPWPPGFHQLGYTGLGHRSLLLSVTQFMRNR